MDASTHTKIELHGPLGAMFGREHSLYVSSPGEAIRALCSQFRGFRETVAAPGASYALLVGGLDIPLEALRMESGNREIHLVPVVEGAGGGAWTNILAGVAIVAAAYFLGPAGAAIMSKAVAGYVVGMGVAMALGGVAMLLAPTPKAGINERPENKPSELFDGPVNTIAQNHPIQICYGEVEIGSAIISTMIDYSEGSNQGWGGGIGGGGGHFPPEHPYA